MIKKPTWCSCFSADPPWYNTRNWNPYPPVNLWGRWYSKWKTL